MLIVVPEQQTVIIPTATVIQMPLIMTTRYYVHVRPTTHLLMVLANIVLMVLQVPHHVMPANPTREMDVVQHIHVTAVELAKSVSIKPAVVPIAQMEAEAV